MRKALWISLALFLSGCGVKGRPLPPLNPTLPGDGRLKSEKKKAEKKKTSSSFGEMTEGE